MMEGARVAKVALIVGGIVWLGGWVAVGARAELASPWLAAGLATLLAYGALGWLSYRGARVRVAAASAAALLTFAIAWVSFAHFGLVLGGLAVTGGCLVPAERAPLAAATQATARPRQS